MSLVNQYDTSIEWGQIHSSPSQRQAIIALENVSIALGKKSWLPWYTPTIMGVYLYGPVGAGKTYAMDLFFNALTDIKKARYHFHHFMQMVDSQLRQLQGMRNPVKYIARTLARSIRVLCLDEFLVHDVADAMILADLLQALLHQNVILVATANTAPDDLYLDGVHRERFLPAIALIKEHCQVITVDDQTDHRLGKTPLLNAYFTPLTRATYEAFAHQFKIMAGDISKSGLVIVQKREIAYIQKGDEAIWFDFNVICNLPRSQLDYLELADRFKCIFVSNIPSIAAEDTIHAILFIHFIDVMYDKKTQVIISAEVTPDKLYPTGPLRESFKRTESRLQEMQSQDYFQRN